MAERSVGVKVGKFDPRPATEEAIWDMVATLWALSTIRVRA